MITTRRLSYTCYRLESTMMSQPDFSMFRVDAGKMFSSKTRFVFSTTPACSPDACKFRVIKVPCYIVLAPEPRTRNSDPAMPVSLLGTAPVEQAGGFTRVEGTSWARDRRYLCLKICCFLRCANLCPPLNSANYLQSIHIESGCSNKTPRCTRNEPHMQLLKSINPQMGIFSTTILHFLHGLSGDILSRQ